MGQRMGGLWDDWVKGWMNDAATAGCHPKAIVILVLGGGAQILLWQPLLCHVARVNLYSFRQPSRSNVTLPGVDSGMGK